MLCSGTPTPCPYIYHDGQCLTCGCMWDDYMEWCEGNPDDCTDHTTEGPCEECGCTWTPIGIEINIGDVWKSLNLGATNTITICQEHVLGGHTWKLVTGIWINIGDVWKQAY